MTGLETIRNDFELNSSIYLMNHAAGRLLKASESNFSRSYFDALRSNDPWSIWMPALADFTKQLGILLNSPADNFCPQSNVSSALTKILFSLPKEHNTSTILLSEHDFPSVGFVVQQMANAGYRIKFLSKQLDQTDVQVWKDALTDDVQWAIITQAQSNTGAQIPVKEIVQICNERNILSVVDIAQSIGVLPIDINDWNPSFVIGSCLKWLCSGAGAGFLYVHPTVIEKCRPQDVGWFSHEQPFEFDIHNFRYHSTALKFRGGTPVVAPFIIAAHSIAYFNTVGIEIVRTHNLYLTQLLIDSVNKDYIVSPLLPPYRTGTLILHFKERHETIVETLKQNNVQFDTRAFGIRLSPHVYNTQDEIEKVIGYMLD